MKFVLPVLLVATLTACGRSPMEAELAMPTEVLLTSSTGDEIASPTDSQIHAA